MNGQQLQIRDFLGKEDLSLACAMREIETNAHGILFLVDKNDKLVACITDGDIRRFLLNGGKMDDRAIEAANCNPCAARSEIEAKTKSLNKNYLIIPVVDDEGRVVGLYGNDGERIRKNESLSTPVVINAGGQGTRLEPYTKVLPKPLIPVGELPIIELIMKGYQAYDCNEFHIIVNYKRELMKAYFSDNDNHYDIKWYDEEAPLGTGGGLAFLKGKLDRTFIFSSCDALLSADYGTMLDFHKRNNNVITMICAYKNIAIPYGVVEMGLNGRIENMEEKPVFSFLANTGIYIVEPEVLDDIDYNTPIDFPEIVDLERNRGKNVAVFPISESDWMDMGQLPELEKMRNKLYGE